MRRAYFIGLTLLLTLPSWEPAAGRDVKEIGLRALRKGRIATTKPARDFTRIPPDANYAPDRLLIRFAPNPDLTAPAREQKDRILSALGGSIQREYDLVPGLTVVTLPANMPVNEDTLRRFNNVPGILYAEPDYQIGVAVTPNDPSFGSQWALYNPPYGSNDINAREAWDVETGSDEIVVAVVDSGVNYNHGDLAANMWTNGSGQFGYDWVNGDADPMDDNGHGTHCAGIIGAVGNNGVGIAGVCWDVRIMALKFIDAYGYGWASNGLAAIEYATANGAHVISCSWRYYPGDPYFNVSPATMEETLNAAGEANIMIAAAAGNESLNIDTNPCYPPCCNSDNVIVVGASTSSGTRASFSNYGLTKVDLFAPGEGIYSCYGSGYTWASGTSMAAPHVAGACALLLSLNPSLSCTQVKSIIMDDVTWVSALSPYCVTGGLLNLYSAATDPDVGVISYPSLVARNSSGTIKAWIDSWGNLVLRGTLLQNQTSYPSLNGIKIRNSAGTVVAALDRENGDMRISGQCHEFQNSPLTPTNANWVIKDSDGAVQAYLNSTGHLYMLGEVFDGI
jgi:subtilisin family serine protease